MKANERSNTAGKNKGDDVEQVTLGDLTRAEFEEVQDFFESHAKKHLIRRRDEKRFRYAVGILLVAPICVAVACLPAPGMDSTERGIWILIASLSLAVGGWELRKSAESAAKNSNDDDQESPPAQTGSSNIRSIR